ncbi:DUF6790 family protein [Actinomycetospora sp. CA-084318]|uniref:DUF6790 family protein n=1 Tax=Actinomycetospora sp. CA-084318 TaxID=3239892 RepID=UPI003D998E20
MSFFLFMWIVLLGGLVLHVILDRSPDRRSGRRILQLTSLWFVAVGLGVNGVLAGLVHMGPGAAAAAESIGWSPSPFQWENGGSDLAVGLAALAVVRTRFRGGWMSATILVAFVQLWLDGIQHVTQWLMHGNTAPDNVGAIPTCFLVPLVAAITTWAARRAAARHTTPGAHEGATPARVPA